MVHIRIHKDRHHRKKPDTDLDSHQSQKIQIRIRVSKKSDPGADSNQDPHRSYNRIRIWIGNNAMPIRNNNLRRYLSHSYRLCFWPPISTVPMSLKSIVPDPWHFWGGSGCLDPNTGIRIYSLVFSRCQQQISFILRFFGFLSTYC